MAVGADKSDFLWSRLCAGTQLAHRYDVMGLYVSLPNNAIASAKVEGADLTNQGTAGRGVFLDYAN